MEIRLALRRSTLLFGLLITGCAHVFTDVTVFAEPSYSYTGKTFYVMAVEKHEGSLEAKTYGDMVARSLAAKGLIRTSDKDKADLIVVFAYGDLGRRDKNVDLPTFVPGQTITATTYTPSGPVTTYATTSPTVGSDSISITHHARIFSAVISAKEKRVYEIKATSEGVGGEFANVARHMIVSAFEFFPGENGKVITVSKRLNGSDLNEPPAN